MYKPNKKPYKVGSTILWLDLLANVR